VPYWPAGTGSDANATETAEEPKKTTETARKKVDPTESVTEGQMKGGAL
jgi:hypothetical protein